MAGAAIGRGIASDKKIKKDVKAHSSEISLSAVRKIPVKSWKYKPGSVADDGGQPHVGPMAQDVRASLGDAVAPGGKTIDVVNMNGHTLAAVQALDKKVTRLSLAVKKAAHA